jgi:hypothetical protein
MSNKYNKQNPFESDENLTPVFESSDRYQSTKNQALQAFKSTQPQSSKTNNKPTFNLSQFMSYNFSHFTRFSIAGLAVFTLLAGGLSAQALAPDILKPTQIAQTIKDKYFSANKQDDGDPKVALKADDTNYVAYLEGCDLGLKFPKTIDKRNTVTSFRNNSFGSDYTFGPEFDYSMMGQTYADEYKVNINCSKLTERYNTDSNYGILEMRGNTIDKTDIGLNTFQNETGWFASNSKDIKNIKKFSQKIQDPDSKELFNGYSFDYRNQRIVVSLDKDINITSLKFNDFQLQFASQIATEVKSNNKLFSSNLPTAKETDCDKLLNIKYNQSIPLNISKSNDSTGGNISIDNFTYVKGEYARKPEDGQIIIQCNNSFTDTLKKSYPNYKSTISFENLPSLFTPSFKSKIKPENINGAISTDSYNKGEYDLIITDNNGNTYKILMFNFSFLANTSDIGVDLK